MADVRKQSGNEMTEVNKMTKENGGERDAVIAECAGESGVGQY